MVATAARRVVCVERRGGGTETSGTRVWDARGDDDASRAIAFVCYFDVSG